MLGATGFTILTSVASTFAAIGSCIAAYKLNRLEENRDKQAQKDKEQKHSASFVVLGMLDNDNKDAKDEPKWSLWIQNTTGKPVFNVEIESQKLTTQPCRNPPLTLSCVPCGTFLVHSDARYNWGYLLPYIPSRGQSFVARSAKPMVTSFKYKTIRGEEWEKTEKTDCAQQVQIGKTNSKSKIVKKD